jgi:hypothetical protein
MRLIAEVPNPAHVGHLLEQAGIPAVIVLAVMVGLWIWHVHSD